MSLFLVKEIPKEERKADQRRFSGARCLGSIPALGLISHFHWSPLASVPVSASVTWGPCHLPQGGGCEDAVSSDVQNLTTGHRASAPSWAHRLPCVHSHYVAGSFPEDLGAGLRRGWWGVTAETSSPGFFGLPWTRDAPASFHSQLLSFSPPLH